VKYSSYNASNFEKIVQLQKVDKDYIRDMKIVAKVLPFKVSNYVIEELIDWDNYEKDPIFHLVFPNKDMLIEKHYLKMKSALDKSEDKNYHIQIANEIRLELNPNPAGQKKNVPIVDGVPLVGVQHKYRETLLYFPSAGQTCHSYCTFCFRWPQFIGMNELKFALKEGELLLKYLQDHKEITDLLFTGGDPMTMSASNLRTIIAPIIADGSGTNIQTIRIGTKSLAFWPYRFTSAPDADDIIKLFSDITSKGINLAIMAHFSHPKELETIEAIKAIQRIRSTGAQIRTQSPILKHINDDPKVWSEMWRKQVNLNLIPYYMFVPRDTGAQHYFALTLLEVWEIWRNAYQNVSGVCRTVRGPSMSCTPGKVQFLGPADINDEKVFVLRFLQGRNPNWVQRPFFAKYDEKAIWMNNLKPAFGDKFFFEEEEEKVYGEKYYDTEIDNFE